MNILEYFKVRLCRACNLIFFGCILWCCRPSTQVQPEIIWDGDRAVAISVPAVTMFELAGSHRVDSLHIRLKSTASIPMLGTVEQAGSQLVFRPLVPLTAGLTYEILSGNRMVYEVTIPLADISEAATVSIYPSQDTVPENLLKIYLKFSRPMQEGNALNQLVLQNANGDTMRGVFLDLKPELWNADHDMLTMWLDPGRIKRGLHPNQQLGQPLVRGMRYMLSVRPDWKDIDGVALEHFYQKEFVVATRDSVSPVPSRWIIEAPGANTTDNLCIHFAESLDYALLRSALHIASSTGADISGQWTTDREETMACFTPKSAWQPGKYSLEVESRLEDLCGNNIDRPFEVDISQRNSPSKGKRQDSVRLGFVVQANAAE